MPRIRTIKPDIWDSPDFIALDMVGQLTFLALITLADDEGRLRMDATHLHLIAIRHGTAEQIDQQLRIMADLHMISRYSHDGCNYIQLANWVAHQKVDHAKPSTYPAPPNTKSRAKRREASRGVANVREDSRSLANSRAPADRIEEGIGKEGKGEEPVRAVFEAWLTSLPEGAKRELTDHRRRAINGALSRASLEDCLAAVRGWRWDDWVRRPQVNDIEDCLRPANLEKFRDWEFGINRPSAAKPTSENGEGPQVVDPELIRDQTPEEKAATERARARLQAEIQRVAQAKAMQGSSP